MLRKEIVGTHRSGSKPEGACLRCLCQVFGYCMFKDGREAKVQYPTEGFSGEVAGRSFHNGGRPLP